jgi:hypothetical protein
MTRVMLAHIYINTRRMHTSIPELGILKGLIILQASNRLDRIGKSPLNGARHRKRIEKIAISHRYGSQQPFMRAKDFQTVFTTISS